MSGKLLYILFFLILPGSKAIACDICGCGIGNYYIGILPEFKKKFIGLRYQHKGLTTHLNPDRSRSYLTTDETYQTLELWGAWNVGEKFRLIGFLPLNMNERTNQGITNSKKGIGDIAVVGYYNLFKNEHTANISSKRVVQSLWVGAGIKLPTGKYNPVDKRIVQSDQNTFQLGTGSVDLTLNTMYDFRIHDAGLNTNLSYKINTRNKYGYIYGNKLTANVLGYYKFRIANKLTIAPNTGVVYEKAGYDSEGTENKVEESGGFTLMGTLGLEMSFGKIGIGLNAQRPLSQDLASGIANAKNRAMAHVSFGL